MISLVFQVFEAFVVVVLVEVLNSLEKLMSCLLRVVEVSLRGGELYQGGVELS